MGDVHMKVSIHTASHIDTRLVVARVRVTDRVRVRISYSQASRVINLEWLYTRAKLAMCIASAFLPRCIVCNAVFPMSICPSVCRMRECFMPVLARYL